MGGALARGWAGAGTGPDTVMVSDPNQNVLQALVDDVGGSKATNREIADSADVIVLAVKPAVLKTVAEEIRVTVSDRAIPIVSMLAGTEIALIEEAFGPGTPILRFMPNVAVEVRAGTLCYVSNDALGAGVERDLHDLFGQVGDLVPVPEALMDAATALSGAGPAFFALVIEALVDAGVREGLTAPQASELAVATMGGTAALLSHHQANTVELRRRVTSPGGATAAGLAALEQHKLRAAFDAAVEAVISRAREFHR
jgi:pyrroline-5-carboxylate reductase